MSTIPVKKCSKLSKIACYLPQDTKYLVHWTVEDLNELLMLTGNFLCLLDPALYPVLSSDGTPVCKIDSSGGLKIPHLTICCGVCKMKMFIHIFNI